MPLYEGQMDVTGGRAVLWGKINSLVLNIKDKLIYAGQNVISG